MTATTRTTGGSLSGSKWLAQNCSTASTWATTRSGECFNSIANIMSTMLRRMYHLICYHGSEWKRLRQDTSTVRGSRRRWGRVAFRHKQPSVSERLRSVAGYSATWLPRTCMCQRQSCLDWSSSARNKSRSWSVTRCPHVTYHRRFLSVRSAESSPWSISYRQCETLDVAKKFTCENMIDVRKTQLVHDWKDWVLPSIKGRFATFLRVKHSCSPNLQMSAKESKPRSLADYALQPGFYIIRVIYS